MKIIPHSEFERVRKSKAELHTRLETLASLCRYNTLVSVKRAGSGHLGTSFSAMDIASFLYFHHLNLKDVGPTSPERDLYFSSKGHDVPGTYSILYGLGLIPEERYLKLRRLGGLDGHPDVKIPGIEANSGSLGMGISKARGMLHAKRMQKRGGRVLVMVGDGEFQEGQNFEALQTTVAQGITDLTVVMDHNKLQSDRLVNRIVDLGDLAAKITSFGWHVVHCDGHDFKKIDACFAALEKVTDRPKFVIFDTIKGRGVSFMEHPTALANNNGFYKWHAGAPDDDSFARAEVELEKKVLENLERCGLSTPRFTEVDGPQRTGQLAKAEYLVEVYGDALLDQAVKNERMVVLDADLSADCRLRKFEDTYPKRFFESGIAEQDMVSQAGGMALQGLVPIVNSFASFLAARANEQIYNNATENRKIIYMCHFSGLLPAAPGKSHQSIRDISLFGAFPNVEILQPASADETRAVLDYAVNTAPGSCMIRLPIGPSPRTITLPAGYQLQKGRGVALTPGDENVLIAYGPIMLHEALVCAETLQTQGIALKVINLPWLNRFDGAWLESELGKARRIFVLEDHARVGGLGDRLLAELSEKPFFKQRVLYQVLGVDGYPACGAPKEVLEFHRLDGASLAMDLTAAIRRPSAAQSTGNTR